MLYKRGLTMMCYTLFDLDNLSSRLVERSSGQEQVDAHCSRATSTPLRAFASTIMSESLLPLISLSHANNH
jgi:hypothetical protein